MRSTYSLHFLSVALNSSLWMMQVKRADMSAVMQDLGADWDEDELADALEALDPLNSGYVHFLDFLEWWSD